MLTLLLILHVFIGSTLAGAGVIVALTLGMTGAGAILWSAAIGFVAAFPVSWMVARRLTERSGQ